MVDMSILTLVSAVHGMPTQTQTIFLNKDFYSGGYVNINSSVSFTRYANANTNYFSPNFPVNKDFDSGGYVNISPLYSCGFSHILIQ